MNDRTRELECVISDLKQQARDAKKVHGALHNALSRHHAREMGEGRDHYHSLTKLTVSAYQQSGLCADTIAALEATPSTRLPEKLCYDSRWEIPIDYVDGWNAAVDMMRGKSPSWHCPDCCIAFPFGAPKACPHDDARCNKLLADDKESA